ncbi:hypothetical protein [Mesorhizobium sp.]|nr:hypothetical protein [Mesorhizobium sp.]TIO06576.1 MAG: hypothetical protein E5X88_22010 [Mesorhizobium sp.]TIO31521.1 MAG: hypothetical protein E5X89_23535 [Mesorhizobium sp.]TIP08306.1 MAG: hypothetical protein E5X73_32345 [Mesorhizobium sp.]
MKNGVFILLATVTALTVCQLSEASAKRNPGANLGGCVTAVHAWGITLKHDIASFMGVSQERMPALFCQRLAEGVRTGRISYSDINSLQLDQPTEIWMVIKGKSKAATQAPAPRTSEFRTCNRNNGTFQIPASRKCPLSGHAQLDQPTEIKMIKGKSKAATPAPRNSKFRTCNGIEGTFQIPSSRKCPLSGYAHY